MNSHTRTIERLRIRLKVLVKFKRMSIRQRATIRRLTRELAAEKRLTAALSRLAFAPAEQQKPGVLKELKRATERRAAA